MKPTTKFNLTVTETAARCAVGEATGTRNIQEGAIPVMSCEGACIRGEIARLAANRVAKSPGFRRACHGELFSVPGSAMATWVRNARDVVVIDGCPLRCHGRIVQHLVDPRRLHAFNALARYRKHTDLFDIDSVPEPERVAIAEDVAQWVVENVAAHPTATAAPSPESGCPSQPAVASAPFREVTGACGSGANGDVPKTHFTTEVAALVGVGAAVAANCEPCLDHHAKAAEQQGVSREDVGRAVALATRVKEAPHRKILAAAERLTRAPEQPAETANATPCCHAASKSTRG